MRWPELAIPLLAISVGGFGCQDSAPADSWEVASQGIYAGAISKDASLTLVGSLNHGASLWRTQDQARLFNWAHQAGEFVQLVAADFSPNGQRAVTTDPRTLVLWDTQSGQALNYWTIPSAALDVALLADGQHVLMGLKDHSALLFDASSGAYQHTLLHQGAVNSVDVSANGQLAITGSDDNSARIWSLVDGSEQQQLNHGNPVRVVSLSASGKYAFTAAQGDRVAVWDTASGSLLHELHHGIHLGVKSARFSADERFLVIGYANRQVAIFDVATGQRLKRWDPGTRHAMRATGAAILEVAFDDSGQLIYALAGDGRLLTLRIS